MNGNKIGKKGALAFAQVLQINIGLKELDLGHTDQVSTDIDCHLQSYEASYFIISLENLQSCIFSPEIFIKADTLFCLLSCFCLFFCFFLCFFFFHE